MNIVRTLLTTVLLLPLASPTRADVKIDDDTRKATARALEWLARQQNPDGSWTDGGYAHNTAITSFAMLAFMAQGHLPNQGLYGPEVARAARFLMATQRADGYLVGARGGNMYCHAMATLALAELLGQTGEDELRTVVKKAADLIIKCQNKNGGWRYEPAPTGADISVTIMQVMALRACNNAGLHVPDETRRKAIDYIKSCYNAKVGGFSYQPGGGSPGFARTAAGTCVLFLTRNIKPKEPWEKETEAWIDLNLPRAVEYLQRNFESPVHFWYGHYYAAHAMHQVGGKEWDEWYGRLVKYFLPRQGADGSWSAGSGRREVGPVYQTSISVIILSVPMHYLPIFQR